MKKIPLLGMGAFVALVSMLSSCGVNVDKAERTLRAQGIKDAKIGGVSLWGCGQDDDFASNWTGTGADGKPVSGVICGGWLKGYTVRFD